MAAVAVSPGVMATDILKQAFGAEALKHDSPEIWPKRKVPFLLKSSVKNSGESLRIDTC